MTTPIATSIALLALLLAHPVFGAGTDESLTGVFTQHCIDICGDANEDGLPDLDLAPGDFTDAASGGSYQCKVVYRTLIENITIDDPITFSCWYNSVIGYKNPGILIKDVTNNVPSGTPAIVFDHLEVDNTSYADGAPGSPSETISHGIRNDTPDSDLLYISYGHLSGGARQISGWGTADHTYFGEWCSWTDVPAIGGVTHNEEWQLPFGGSIAVTNSTLDASYASHCESGPSTTGHLAVQTKSGGDGGTVVYTNNLFLNYLSYAIWFDTTGSDPFFPVTVSGNRFSNDFAGNVFGEGGPDTCDGGSWTWSDNQLLDGTPIENPCPPACSDEVDNDGDGDTDYPDDIGCVSADAPREDPECSDGAGNDGDGAIDYAGGPGGEPADPECQGIPWWGPEDGVGTGECGLLGIEVLPVLGWAAWRRRRARGSAPRASYPRAGRRR